MTQNPPSAAEARDQLSKTYDDLVATNFLLPPDMREIHSADSARRALVDDITAIDCEDFRDDADTRILSRIRSIFSHSLR